MLIFSSSSLWWWLNFIYYWTKFSGLYSSLPVLNWVTRPLCGEGGDGRKEGDDNVAGLEHVVVLLCDVWLLFLFVLRVRLLWQVIWLMFTGHDVSSYLPVIRCPSCVQKAIMLEGNDRNNVLENILVVILDSVWRSLPYKLKGLFYICDCKSIFSI